MFRIWNRFNFLDFQDVNILIESLSSNIEKSGYRPDVTVGISRGGDFPAERLSKKLNADSASMQISHYSINLGGFEIDEIVGLYRTAKTLGYKIDARLIRDVNPWDVEEKRVLIVDDDSYSGMTLDMAKKEIGKYNPREIKTAVLHTHEDNDQVGFSGKIYPKRLFYESKNRFPWSKISPYFCKNSFENITI